MGRVLATAQEHSMKFSKAVGQGLVTPAGMKI